RPAAHQLRPDPVSPAGLPADATPAAVAPGYDKIGTMRLLLVEDDPMLGSGMERGLRLAGFTVDRVADGRHALLAIQEQGYDAMLLDITLPKVDGLQVLRSMRQQGIGTPVVLVTARNAIQDRIT